MRLEYKRKKIIILVVLFAITTLIVKGDLFGKLTLSIPQSTNSIDIAIKGIGTNSEWRPYIQQDVFNGVMMVLVPTGSTILGSTVEEAVDAKQECDEVNQEKYNCPNEWFSGENLAYVTFSNPFWIDKTEVTREMYAQCVEDSGCQPPTSSDFIAVNFTLEPYHPITGISWEEAVTYCEWRGTYLPSAAEWEYAARGPDRSIYPWGNTVVGNEANHCEKSCWNYDGPQYRWRNEQHDDNFAVLAPIGIYPHGASWVGALDLAGNASEWTSTLVEVLDPDNNIEEHYIIKGGAFHNTQTALRSASTGTDKSYSSSIGRGFRCARNYEPQIHRNKE